MAPIVNSRYPEHVFDVEGSPLVQCRLSKAKEYTTEPEFKAESKPCSSLAAELKTLEHSFYRHLQTFSTAFQTSGCEESSHRCIQNSSPPEYSQIIKARFKAQFTKKKKRNFRFSNRMASGDPPRKDLLKSLRHQIHICI